jgi:hypothetical protein
VSSAFWTVASWEQSRRFMPLWRYRVSHYH